jgi:hypothetical protein
MAAAIGRWCTDPGDGQSSWRWNEKTLDEFFSPYASQLETSFTIPGGREKVFVLNVGQKA